MDTGTNNKTHPLSELTSTESAASMADEGQVAATRADLVYREAPLAILAALLAGAVLAWVLADSAARPAVWLWFGALVAISAFRYGQVRAFRRLRRIHTEAQWLARFVFGAAASGAAWGAAAIFLFPTGSPFQQALLLLTIGGLAAGSVASYAAAPRASLAFMFTSLVPAAVAFAAQRGEATGAMAILALCYLAIMMLMARRVAQSVDVSLSAALRNQGLVKYLEQAKRESDEVNDQLKREIEDRRQAEQQARDSEARFRGLSDASMEGILVHENGLLLDANRSLADMLACSPEDLIGKTGLDIVAPESRALLKARIMTPADEPFEVLGMRADGSTFPAELSGRDFPYRGRTVRVVTVRDLSRAKAAEFSLRESQQRLILHMEQTPLAVIEWDLLFRVTVWNRAAENIFGYSAAQALGRSAMELVLPESAREHVDAIWGALITQNGGRRSTNENVTRDGRTIVCEWYNTPLVDAEGKVVGVASLAQDITERVRAQEALFREKELAEVTLASIGDAVITTGVGGVIDYINPVAAELIGMDLYSVHGRPLNDVIQLSDDLSGEELAEPVSAILRAKDGGEIRNMTLWRRDGYVASLGVTGAPMRDHDGKVVGVVLVMRDMTEMRVLERQLSYQATHDSLTGLINRAEFERRIESALESSKPTGKSHALLYLDLDQFKLVNDTSGHLAGDELLKQLTATLQGEIRDSDTFARLGGDEFGVLLHACPLDKAREIAEDLCRRVQVFRFVWDNKTFEIGVSIGVVVIGEHSRSLQDVMRAADSACYAAKDRGRNRIHVYEPDDTVLAARHGEMEWTHRITEALDSDRFELYCQRIAATVEDGATEHYEVLLRMLDESGALVPPGAFIPSAERYKLMDSIDRWVIAHTLELLKQSRGNAMICSINISGQSLCDETFLEFVVDALNDSGIDTRRLSFEITETAAIGNLGAAVRFIGRLRKMGCRFSLDDFGSGLSSFAYLKNLNVDYLKIDGGFVKDIVEDAIDRTMVKSINDVGHAMGLYTIAEFVESDAIRAVLREIGVDYVQGYGVEKPRPFREVLENTPFSAPEV